VAAKETEEWKASSLTYHGSTTLGTTLLSAHLWGALNQLLSHPTLLFPLQGLHHCGRCPPQVHARPCRLGPQGALRREPRVEGLPHRTLRRQHASHSLPRQGIDAQCRPEVRALTLAASLSLCLCSGMCVCVCVCASLIRRQWHIPLSSPAASRSSPLHKVRLVFNEQVIPIPIRDATASSRGSLSAEESPLDEGGWDLDCDLEAFIRLYAERADPEVMTRECEVESSTESSTAPAA
jgi:hypothetical protein